MKSRLKFLIPMSILIIASSCNEISLVRVNKNNNEENSYHTLIDGVEVNYLPGQYSKGFGLDFKVTNKNYKLLYTIDGSYPEEQDDNVFKNPIIIDSLNDLDKDNYPLTTSVDGILAGDNGGKCVSNAYNNNIQRTGNYVLSERLNTITIRVINTLTNETIYNRALTYIVNEENYTIPIVSLTMPYDNWFGDKNGFYNKIREEIEHRVHLEFLDIANNEYFYRNSKIKLGGNWTLGYPQRTLNLNFNKDENGNKNEKVKEAIFGDRTQRCSDKRLTKLTRFRLHNGGNCFESHSGFNDAVIQSLMEDSNIATTAHRPCLVYLNGEYWGLQYLREHYSDAYFSDNYDVEKDHVIHYNYKGNFIVDDGEPAVAAKALNELLAYLDNDFTSNATYEYFIDNYIDVDSFIDLFLGEAYASNWDFVGNYNNLRMWRVSEIDPNNPYADGRWRFAMHDVDFAFTERTNFLDKNHGNSYSKFNLFAKLLENDNFKERFYQRAVYLVSNNFDPSSSAKKLAKMVEDVKPYKKDALLRWGQKEKAYDDWLNYCEWLTGYFEDRNRSFLAVVNDSLKQY